LDKKQPNSRTIVPPQYHNFSRFARSEGELPFDTWELVPEPTREQVDANRAKTVAWDDGKDDGAAALLQATQQGKDVKKPAEGRIEPNKKVNPTKATPVARVADDDDEEDDDDDGIAALLQSARQARGIKPPVEDAPSRDNSKAKAKTKAAKKARKTEEL
jgi:hypothetical protein